MDTIKPKAYVASRTAKREEVRKIQKKLESMGFEIARDWTICPSAKPYRDNTQTSREYSVEDIKAVGKSDVFIIISDEAGTGMYVELGAAILSNIKLGRPKIFVIGPFNDNLMFYFHDVVSRMEDTEQVFEELEEWMKNRN
jgi:hypothetical protein